MKKEDKKYTTGEIARICNVTKKQLRYYEENDILSPKYKDENTKYRYYSESQIEEILMIKDLKKTDFSLRDISDILKGRDIPLLKKKMRKQIDIAEAEFKNAWEKYEQSIEMYIRVSNALEVLEKNERPDHDTHKFEIVEFPKTQVVYTRYKSNWNANGLFFGRRAELYQVVDAYRLTTRGVPMAIFHGGYMKQFSDRPEDAIGDLEMCITITNSEDCPDCRWIDEFRAVSTIHVGSYPSLKATYEELRDWAAEKGYELADVSLEEYLCGMTMTNDPSKYVTRLYVPLKGTELYSKEHSI